MKTNEILVHEFLEYAGSHQTTQARESLSRLMYRILSYTHEHELQFPLCTLRDAMAFYAWVSEKNISPGSVANYLKTARRFFRYLVLTEEVATNPFLDLRYPRMPQTISRNVLTESQMHRLLRELARFDELPTKLSSIRRYRVHVVSEFLYASGLRIAEAAALTTHDIDLSKRLVYVAKGKGGQSRIAFLGSYARDLMTHYLKEGRAVVLGNYGRKDTHTLFGTHYQRLMSVMNEELKELCQSLNLPPITSHSFRHSLGTHLLRAGCDLRHIQAILGHEKLGSTQVYTHVDKDDLRRSLDSFHPRMFNTRETRDASR